jgi:hypothetical protein
MPRGGYRPGAERPKGSKTKISLAETRRLLLELKQQCADPQLDKSTPV